MTIIPSTGSLPAASEATPTANSDPLLSRKDAAAYLSASLGTPKTVPWLAKCAFDEIGPLFITVGLGPRPRVFYRRSALNDWIAESVSPARRGRLARGTRAERVAA